MIAPHGGRLVNRLLPENKKEEVLEKLKYLPTIIIDSDVVSEVENIGTGVYSPLEGFLNK
ncbi:MAG TPA: sulfate adenylyltransferase, partial [Candidatus Aminicenantes bacterium]|nr:sulfate adenylyltransferase [Candidatus Aminicenantes bacterium]